MAHATHEIIGGGFAFFDGHYLDGIGLVVGSENQVIAGGFDILDGAGPIFQHGIHVELAFAVGF